MLLTDMQNEVYLLTKRPDKVNETLSALRTALLKCHTQDFFTKDILETGIAFTASSTQQSFTYKALIPLWRALSYIQPLSLDSGTGLYGPQGKPLEEIAATNILDQYDYYKDNVYYEAGQVLQIRTNPAFQYFQVGAYLFPDVSVGSSLQSWVTADYPYAVIYDAAATIFRSIGFVEQMKELQAMAAELRGLIITSNILATGE